MTKVGFASEDLWIPSVFLVDCGDQYIFHHRIVTFY